MSARGFCYSNRPQSENKRKQKCEKIPGPSKRIEEIKVHENDSETHYRRSKEEETKLSRR